MQKAIIIDLSAILRNTHIFELYEHVVNSLVVLQRESDYSFILADEHYKGEYVSKRILLNILKSEGFEFNSDISVEDINYQNSFIIKSGLTLPLKFDNKGIQTITLHDEHDKHHEVILPDNEHAEQFHSWSEITEYILLPERKAEVIRKTNETDIYIQVSLEKNDVSEISTGLNFFNHMLEQIARHSGCAIKIKVNGDLHVDEHHTIEDTGIALGEAMLKALGNKLGIGRYGFLLPMDDCLAQVAIDFSGRPWLVWDVEFKREFVGDLPTEMVYHFFKSFSDAARCNLNIKAEGENEHHKIEAIFKALAKAIKMAIKRDVQNMILPSTKGSL